MDRAAFRRCRTAGARRFHAPGEHGPPAGLSTRTQVRHGVGRHGSSRATPVGAQRSTLSSTSSRGGLVTGSTMRRTLTLSLRRRRGPWVGRGLRAASPGRAAAARLDDRWPLADSLRSQRFTPIALHHKLICHCDGIHWRADTRRMSLQTAGIGRIRDDAPPMLIPNGNRATDTTRRRSAS